MHLTYDQGADALYIQFSDAPVARTDEVAEGTAIDFDRHGHPVGVEFLDVSEGINLRAVPHAVEIAELLKEYPFSISA
jgi:uncharacterized protein YuzE